MQLTNNLSYSTARQAHFWMSSLLLLLSTLLMRRSISCFSLKAFRGCRAAAVGLRCLLICVTVTPRARLTAKRDERLKKSILQEGEIDTISTKSTTNHKSDTVRG